MLDVQLQVSHSHSSSQTLIQLLYYIMVGGERKIDVARVVGWKAASLHREGQVSTRKGTAWILRALHVSLVVVQYDTSQWGEFYNLWPTETEIPFMVVLDVHAKLCISLPPMVIMLLARAKGATPFINIPLLLPQGLSTCRTQIWPSQHVCLHWLVYYTHHLKLNPILLIFYFFLFFNFLKNLVLCYDDFQNNNPMNIPNFSPLCMYGNIGKRLT